MVIITNWLLFNNLTRVGTPSTMISIVKSRLNEVIDRAIVRSNHVPEPDLKFRFTVV